jgi:hypothetical protein
MENSEQVIQYLEELAKALPDLSVTSPFHNQMIAYILHVSSSICYHSQEMFSTLFQTNIYMEVSFSDDKRNYRIVSFNPCTT